MNQSQKNSIDQTYPIHTVFIELTNKCNFRCNFCPIDRTKRPIGEMDFMLSKRVIDEIHEKKISDRIAFHLLGEPLLSKNLFRAMDYAASKGLRIALSTNGSLLTPAITKRLMSLDCMSLSISLETIDRQEHESRGSRIPFDAYYKRILNAVALMANHSNFEITLTLMNTSSRKYFDMDKNIGINTVDKNFKGKVEQLIGDIKNEINEKVNVVHIKKQLKHLYLNRPQNIWITKQIKIYIQLLSNWGNAFTRKKIYPVKLGCCGYTLKRIGILQDGRVTLCCVDYNGDTTIGNIKRSSLSDIITSDYAATIMNGYKKNKVVHPHCQMCIGDPNRIKAWIKGLLSIYLFKLRAHPLDAPEIKLY